METKLEEERLKEELKSTSEENCRILKELEENFRHLERNLEKNSRSLREKLEENCNYFSYSSISKNQKNSKQR